MKALFVSYDTPSEPRHTTRVASPTSDTSRSRSASTCPSGAVVHGKPTGALTGDRDRCARRVDDAAAGLTRALPTPPWAGGFAALHPLWSWPVGRAAGRLCPPGVRGGVPLSPPSVSAATAPPDAARIVLLSSSMSREGCRTPPPVPARRPAPRTAAAQRWPLPCGGHKVTAVRVSAYVGTWGQLARGLARRCRHAFSARAAPSHAPCAARASPACPSVVHLYRAPSSAAGRRTGAGEVPPQSGPTPVWLGGLDQMCIHRPSQSGSETR